MAVFFIPFPVLADLFALVGDALGICRHLGTIGCFGAGLGANLAFAHVDDGAEVETNAALTIGVALAGGTNRLGLGLEIGNRDHSHNDQSHEECFHKASLETSLRKIFGPNPSKVKSPIGIFLSHIESARCFFLPESKDL